MLQGSKWLLFVSCMFLMILILTVTPTFSNCREVLYYTNPYTKLCATPTRNLRSLLEIRQGKSLTMATPIAPVQVDTPHRSQPQACSAAPPSRPHCSCSIVASLVAFLLRYCCWRPLLVTWLLLLFLSNAHQHNHIAVRLSFIVITMHLSLSPKSSWTQANYQDECGIPA